jgi:hypothetical protein
MANQRGMKRRYGDGLGKQEIQGTRKEDGTKGEVSFRLRQNSRRAR